jgi:AAA+ ATPase superfamily predicted ATPase
MTWLPLCQTKKSLIGFALYGKRRIGKTSIFKEVYRRLKAEENIVPVYFSLWDLVEGSVSELIRKFSSAVLEEYRARLSLKYKAKELLKSPVTLLKDILREMEMSVKLRDDIEFLMSFRGGIDHDLIERAFNLPEQLAQETKTKCILLMDEFPSIMDLKNGSKIGEGIIKKIRTIHEYQKRVVLCISGSIRKTMEIVALSSTSAFYHQFVVREVKPLSERYVYELIHRNTRKKVSKEALRRIFEFSNGIPFYVQFLGRELERKEKIEAKDVEEAVDEFLMEEGNVIFKEEFGALSPKERAIIVAMATEELSTPSKIAKSTSENLNAVGMYLRYLEEKGVIRRENKGIYSFEDPVFKRWLTWKYRK